MRICPVGVISGQNCHSHSHRLRYFIAHPKLSAFSCRNEVCDSSSASVKHGWKTLRSLRPLRENINHLQSLLSRKSQRIWAEKSTLSVWKSLVNGYIFFGVLTIPTHYIAYCHPLYSTLGPIVSTVYSLQSTFYATLGLKK